MGGASLRLVWEHRGGTRVPLDIGWVGGGRVLRTLWGDWDCLGTPGGYWDFSLGYWGVLLGRGLETLEVLGHP